MCVIKVSRWFFPLSFSSKFFSEPTTINCTSLYVIFFASLFSALHFVHKWTWFMGVSYEKKRDREEESVYKWVIYIFIKCTQLLSAQKMCSGAFNFSAVWLLLFCRVLFSPFASFVFRWSNFWFLRMCFGVGIDSLLCLSLIFFGNSAQITRMAE